MPESQTNLHPQSKRTVDRPWHRPRWLALWILIGFVIPIGYLVWPYIGSPEPIIVSRETTYLTDQELKDGLVDYYSVLAAELREAGVPSISEDPWMKEAAPNPPWVNWELTASAKYQSYPQLLQFIDQETQDESTRLKWEDRMLLGEFLRLHPWDSKSHPTLAPMIAANADWYAEAQQNFVPYSPIDVKRQAANSPPFNASKLYIVAEEVESAFLDRFALRAAFRWGSGNVDEAIEDVKFALQIANRHQHDRYAVGRGMPWESRVFTLVINCLLESSDVSSDTFRKIAELPTDSTRPQFANILKTNRLRSLDSIQREPRGLYSSFLVDSKSRFVFLHRRRLRINTDWNEMMRATNRVFDQMEAAMEITNSAEALRAMESIEPPDVGYQLAQRLKKRSLLQSAPSTEDVIAAHGYFRRNSIDGFIWTVHRDLQRQVVQVVAGLVAWKQEYGQYPGSLDQLTSSDAAFQIKPEFLIDPFSATHLLYKRTMEGFELRSVGGNQRRPERIPQAWSLEWKPHM